MKNNEIRDRKLIVNDNFAEIFVAGAKRTGLQLHRFTPERDSGDVVLKDNDLLVGVKGIFRARPPADKDVVSASFKSIVDTKIKKEHALIVVLIAALVFRQKPSLLKEIARGNISSEDLLELNRPPNAAKFLLLLIPLRNREGIIGDLEEEYRTILIPEFGRRLAQSYYWWHAILACVSSVTGALGGLSRIVRRG